MDNPNQIVQNMKKQGLNSNQITQYLQREGFTPSQINQAMQQATTGSEYQPSSLQPSPEQLPTPTQPITQEPPQPEPIPAPITQELPQEPVAITEYEMSNRDLQEQIEIISESVIAEKWREFLKSIGNVSAWKSNTDSQIINLQKDFKKTQIEIENLKDSILNKIDQYQESITEINAEMKALQKLFKQLLPSIKKISK